MLMFCPTCGNILTAEERKDNFRMVCGSCPYNYIVRKRLSSRLYPKLKEVDDVLGGAKAWENVETTEENCPKCGHPKAYFLQIQTRSADEPMTTFYKCVDCAHRWKE
ncbi:DNA-directed RNA polymerase III subunit RPC10 [Parasteatoda tepidariorum]|uniref:DNA-directed RNA polymerase subunit n=1 Tax=Parasteatoda tepidariorum TaxID=114398 RepID=A0A2L2YBE2_PARTP|nr:DNA-directed RNA polymerase III subunit RPC10 [Parasteatoda tepidariorum]